MCDRNRGRDDLSNQMEQMNMGAGGNRGEQNMYSQSRQTARGNVPRPSDGLANPGNLVRPANAPIAKADLPHNSQTFAKRPDKFAYDRKEFTKKLKLWTNHALVQLPTEPIKLYHYNIEVKRERKRDEVEILNTVEKANKVFRSIADDPRNGFPPAQTYIFNGANQLWTVNRLRYSEGRVGGTREYFEYKSTLNPVVELGGQVGNLQDNQLIATIVDAIATARTRNPRMCGNHFSVFNRCTFMIQDRTETENLGDATIFSQLSHGVDARLGISFAVKLNLRAGITACYDIHHTLFSRPGYPLIRLFWELIYGKTIKDEVIEEQFDREMQNAVVTDTNKKNMCGILLNKKLLYTFDDAIVLDKLGQIASGDLQALRRRRATFTFFDLVLPANQQTFTWTEGNMSRVVTIAEYFLEKYNIRLRYPNLPCVQKKKSSQKFIAFPMEYVSLTYDPERYGNFLTDRMKSELIQYTTFSATQRLQVLQHIMAQNTIADCPPFIDNGDVFMRRHQVSIGREMLSVKAVVLPAPTVVYGEGDKYVDTDNMGSWDQMDETTVPPIRKVLEGAVLKRTKGKDEPSLTKRILGSILRVGDPLGATVVETHDDGYHHLLRDLEDVGQPVVWQELEESEMLEEQRFAVIQTTGEFNQETDEAQKLYDFFRNIRNDAKSYPVAEGEVIVPLVFVLFPQKCTNNRCGYDHNQYFNDYNLIKWLGENELGVQTQGMLCSVYNDLIIEPSYRRNLVEKILGKIGTTHRKLESGGDHKSWTTLTNPKEPTLILGVDVCHPSDRELRKGNFLEKLSVASIVGNIDLDCTEYRSSSKIQDVGQERIVQFSTEVLHRINGFGEHTGQNPQHIVVYRDGLAESDFQRTLYEEKRSIEAACQLISVNYKPTITYIVATKRHHTSFFLKNPEQDGRPELHYNIPPGTLVEDTVTTKDYFDFYLNTQPSNLHLVRPVHYYILHDTWGRTAAFWSTVTHALAYLFCRSTNTVNLPAPLLYAHLAAKRAKALLDGALTAKKLNDREMFNPDIVLENFAQLDELQGLVQQNEDIDGMTFV